MKTSRQNPVPDLQSVRQAFIRWRSSGASKRQTPVALQRQCVALLGYHSKAEICRTLNIAYGALNRWALDEEQESLEPAIFRDNLTQSDSSGGFVLLPTIGASAQKPGSGVGHSDLTQLHITLANGSVIRADVPIGLLLQIMHSPELGSITAGVNA